MYRETIISYEMSQSVGSDDERSLLSGQTPDFLSTMSSRQRHTSRHSLLDEIIKQVKPVSLSAPLVYMYLYNTSHSDACIVCVLLCGQEGIESPILRGEPLMDYSPEPLGRRPWRASSLPDLFRTRQHLEPIMGSPIQFQVSPAHLKHK